MRLQHVILLSLVAIFLAGCGGFVKSRVTVFHELPANVSGMKYTVVPFKDQEESLEYKSYQQVVKDELQKNGLRESTVDEATLVVFMMYGIDSGKAVISSYPIMGQTGVSSSQTTGSIQTYGSGGTYQGTTTYTPSYGVVGTGVASRTEYKRCLMLNILDKSAFVEKGEIKKLYEAKVVSSGRKGEISEVLPIMIKSLFEEFPGKSGATRSSTRTD